MTLHPSADNAPRVGQVLLPVVDHATNAVSDGTVALVHRVFAKCAAKGVTKIQKESSHARRVPRTRMVTFKAPCRMLSVSAAVLARQPEMRRVSARLHFVHVCAQGHPLIQRTQKVTTKSILAACRALTEQIAQARMELRSKNSLQNPGTGGRRLCLKYSLHALSDFKALRRKDNCWLKPDAARKINART